MSTSGGNPGGSTSNPAVTRVQDGAGALLAQVDALGNGRLTGVNALTVAAAGFLYDGSSQMLQSKMASALNLAAQSGSGAALVAPPGQWSGFSAPAVNVQATVSRAAGGAGVRHVATGLFVTAGGGTVAPAVVDVQPTLRDGASGVGTQLTLKSVGVPAVAGTHASDATSPLNLPGSAATAMTAEFTAAGGANVFESVVITGYDAS